MLHCLNQAKTHDSRQVVCSEWIYSEGSTYVMPSHSQFTSCNSPSRHRFSLLAAEELRFSIQNLVPAGLRGKTEPA
jgi:hypothetical protein